MKSWLLGASAALMAASAAQAQTAPDQAKGLNEIVVTAQKREQSAQSLGVALTVLSGQDLVTRGVNSVNGLQYQTPALEITPAFGSGQPNFRLRGVGFDDYASNNTSPVGVYLDEVAYPFPVETQGLLFDVARVEVLRGPQGTLYGRNTTGGAINFVTNRPTDALSVGVSGEYGAYDYGKVEGYVSGSILDGVALRLSGVTEQGGAFQKNRDTGESIGAANRYALRGQVAARRGPLDVLVEAYYNRDRSDGQGLYLFQPETTPTGVIPADSNPFHTAWGSASPDFTAYAGFGGNTKPFKNNTGAGLNANISYDLGGVKLTSITGYQNFARREYNDWDASAANFAGAYFHTGANVVSEELRLASDGKGALKWVTGLYLSQEHLRDAFITDFADNLGFAINTNYRQHADTQALFGQAEYQLTERLNLIGGLRVEHEARKLLDYSTLTNPAIPLGGGAVLGVQGLSSSSDYTQASGKVAAEYRLTPGVLGYASISRGVKSGGFSAYNTVQASQLHAIRPEILWAYEVGFKSEFAEHTVQLNGAAYYYDYKDQQVQSAIPTFAGPIGNIVNAPSSHIWGVEGELRWRPVPALQITQALAYKKGYFDKFTGLDAVSQTYIKRDGQDEGFPPLSYNGSASYTLAVGDYQFVAEGDYSFRDRLHPVLLGSAYDIKAYWLANATLTLSPKAGPWSVGLWGRNIFDQRYDLTRNFFTGDSAGQLISIAAPGAPATYGVRLGYNY